MNEEVLKLLKNDFKLYFRVGLNECYYEQKLFLKLFINDIQIHQTFIILRM